MLQFADFCSAEAKESINRSVARFIHGLGFPFATVDKKLTKEMFRELQPGYKPPNPQAIGEKWLDIIYKEEVTKNKSLLGSDGSKAALLIDGYKNSVTNRKLIATMLRIRDRIKTQSNRGGCDRDRKRAIRRKY